MDYKTFNLCLVCLFLLINLIVGLRAGRGVSTMKEYVLGNKSFGVISLVLTLIASDIGGTAILAGCEYAFSEGIVFCLRESLPIVLCLIVAYLIVPNFSFINCLTLGDIMKSLYGKYAGIITGLFGFIHSTCVAGMEILILSKVCSSLLSVSGPWIVVIITLIVTISAIGGIQAITSIDALKFIVMIVGIPTIAYIVSTKAGGVFNIFPNLPKDRLNFFENTTLLSDLPNVLLFGILPFCLTCPFVIQRMLMTNNKKHLRNMFILYGLSYPVLVIILFIISASVLVLAPTIEPDQTILYAINNFLPIGFKSLAVVAIVSIIVSSLDSYIHIAGVVILHDVVSPLLEITGKKPINEFFWSRLSTLIICFLSIFIGLKAQNAVDLLIGTLSFTGPITLIPLLCGIMKIKVDKRSYFYAAIGTLIAYLYTTFFLPEKYSNLNVLLHTVTNAAIFFGSLLIQGKGRLIFLQARKKNKPKKISPAKLFSYLLNLPTHIVSYSRERVEKYGAPYVIFAIFCIVNYVLPFFLWTSSATHYGDEIFYIRLVGGVLLCLLLVEEKWPKYLTPYLPLFWHFVLAYVLAFSNTIMFLATKGSVEWLINVALSIIFLIALVDWVSFFIISSLGVVAGFLIFVYLLGGDISLNLNFETKYLLIYQIFFGTIIGLLFARKKQIKVNELEEGRKSATNLYELATEKLNHNELAPLRVSQSLGDSNMNILAKMYNIRNDIENGNLEMAEENLNALESDILNLVITEEKCIKLHEAEIDLNELSKSLESLCKSKFDYNVEIVVRSKAPTMKCDKMMLHAIILQSIKDIKIDLSLLGITTPTPSIIIDISDTTILYFTPALREYSKTINAIRFTVSTLDSIDHSIFKDKYEKQLVDIFKIPPYRKDIPEKIIAENYLEAHFGLFERIKSSQGIIKIYVLPQNVHEIRPIALDAYSADPDEMQYWPEAVDRESRFQKELSEKAPKVNWDSIQKALDFIRKFHDRQIKKEEESPYLNSIASARILLGMIGTPLATLKNVETSKQKDDNVNLSIKDHDSLLLIYSDLQTNQEPILIATLLNNALKDLAIGSTIIESMFGHDVSTYVLGAINLGFAENSNKISDPEKLKNLVMQNPIPFCIKIATELQNISNIDSCIEEKSRHAKAQEILNKYVAPAKYLGFTSIAEDLESACRYVLKHGTIKGFDFKSEAICFLNFQWTFIRK